MQDLLVGGMFTARAVSSARSTSSAVTSRSLIATMPVELKLRIWLPAMPTNAEVILQSAISSASSSARWIAANRRLDVHHHALFQALRLVAAEAEHLERAVGPKLGDQAHHLGGADVESDDQVLVIARHAP